MQQIFNFARTKNCSDIHISAGYKIIFRLNGEIIDYSENKNNLTSEEVYNLIFSLITEEQKKIYLTQKEYDFSFIDNNNLRYRVNAYHTILGPAVAIRIIPDKIKSLALINSPYIVQSLLNYKKGLILIVGPTGSGKSTTLAAMIDHINQNHNKHIITIEDPIEYAFVSQKSLINQREFKTDSNSFNTALKSALRQDPDVIMIGEMRDLETVQLALTAAETGHLVLATLHTNSASQTIDRIIDSFPADQRATIRSIVSNSLRAVISQRLVKKLDGNRCAAFEIMIANSSIRNLIREDKIAQINSMIEINKKTGMILLKDYLKEMASKGTISLEVAEEEIKSQEN
jgi:twitching motility protein PilT